MVWHAEFNRLQMAGNAKHFDGRIEIELREVSPYSYQRVGLKKFFSHRFSGRKHRDLWVFRALFDYSVKNKCQTAVAQTFESKDT